MSNYTYTALLLQRICNLLIQEQKNRDGGLCIHSLALRLTGMSSALSLIIVGSMEHIALHCRSTILDTAQLCHAYSDIDGSQAFDRGVFSDHMFRKEVKMIALHCTGILIIGLASFPFLLRNRRHRRFL